MEKGSTLPKREARPVSVAVYEDDEDDEAAMAARGLFSALCEFYCFEIPWAFKTELQYKRILIGTIVFYQIA